MARYKVTLAYDGTHFFGMQRQAKERTVQAEVEKTLRHLGWKEKSILAAGRTDRGVHARGQVIAFNLDWKHPANKLLEALNANLPIDIAAKSVFLAQENFHPRYDASIRSYRYQLFCKKTRDPLRDRYAWRIWPVLELDRLSDAGQALIGEHDFAAFGRAPKKGGQTIREIVRAEWARENEDEFIFTISANGFLYHMVRRIVGMLVRVGQGSLDLEEIQLALQKKEIIQELAPAQGLTLLSVEYDKQLI